VADELLEMVGDRSRYGLFVSAAGASVLAASVFLPWYGASAAAHVRAGAGSAGQSLVTLDAYHSLSGLSVVMLALAALAMLDVLVPLARMRTPVPGGAGGSVVLLGAIAAACVLYRMVDLPAGAGELLATSLREGAWLALLGSIAMMLGGMWPRCAFIAAPSAARVPGDASRGAILG